MKSCDACIHLHRFERPLPGNGDHFDVERVGICAWAYSNGHDLIVGENFGSMCNGFESSQPKERAA